MSQPKPRNLPNLDVLGLFCGFLPCFRMISSFKALPDPLLQAAEPEPVDGHRFDHCGLHVQGVREGHHLRLSGRARHA